MQLQEIAIIAYLVGIPVNAIVTLIVGYKAGDLKRKYAKTIILFTLTSWVGIVMLACTAYQWLQDQKARQKRLPR